MESRVLLAAPVITSGGTASIAENLSISTVVYDGEATGGDGTITWSLAGTDASDFSINSSTGEVTLNNAANFEVQGSYTFDVIANDGINADVTQSVILSVTNVLETAPTITSGGTGSVLEGAALSTVVYTAAATDADVGDQVTFSLTGTDAALLSINPLNGEVTLNASADFEAQATYNFNVVATDLDGQTDIQAVVLSVTDVNDVAPTVTLTQVVNSIRRDGSLAAGRLVATVDVQDPDGGTVTLSLSGADAALYELRNGDTELWLKAGTAVNYLTNPSLDVTVDADDASLPGSPDGSDSVTVTISTFTNDLIGFDADTRTWHVLASNGVSLTDSVFATWGGTQAVDQIVQGDFNNDGLTDIAGRTASGTWNVGLNNGTTFVGQNWGMWSPSVTWDFVQAGDFDGDGRDDIAGYVKSQGKWYIGHSTGSGFTTSVWLTTSSAVNWGDVHVGDFNGDGRADISMRNLGNGQVSVLRSLGTSFAASVWMTQSIAYNWDFQQVGDFNGDGRDDIASFIASQSKWYVSSSTGNSFTSSLWRSVGAATWGDVTTGDFNGDGRDDLFMRDLGNGKVYALTSTGTSFGGGQWGAWTTAATWSNVRVGDFDGDGRDDVAGYVATQGKWYVARSNGSSLTGMAQWGLWSSSVSWRGVDTFEFSAA